MKFDLHPHQTTALGALRASLLAGYRRPMVQAPTGAGKTVIAAAIVNGALAKRKRVLFVVPFLSRNFAGIVAANSTSRWSSRGGRASSECAIVIRSTLVRMSSGR